MSQCEVDSLHKSVSGYLPDSSRTSLKQSIARHHTGPILNEEFSVGEHITSTCSDSVFSELTATTDELTSVTSNTLSLRYTFSNVDTVYCTALMNCEQLIKILWFIQYSFVHMQH